MASTAGSQGNLDPCWPCSAFVFFLNIFIHLKIIAGKMGLFGIINIMKMCAYILSLLSPH